MRKFHIQTLSDNGGTPMDPVTILTGGFGFLSSIFPNLFDSRQALTRAKLDSIFPGAGYWTVKLKSYLLDHTQYTVDMRYWYPFEGQAGYIQDFAYVNRHEYAPECDSFGNCAWQKFQQILKSEALPGQGSPGGVFPGYKGGVPIETYLIFGGILVTLVVLSKKQKRRSKK